MARHAFWVVVITLFSLSACNLDSAAPPVIPQLPAQQNVPPILANETTDTLISQPDVQSAASIQIPAPATPTQPFADQSDPVLLVASFYNAINFRDYGRAYGYWSSPPNNTSFSQFVQGYADTAAVVGLVRLPLREGVAAGSSYATIQTALISTRSSGSQQIYAGCYVGRISNVPTGDPPIPDPNWRLYDGRAVAVVGPVTPVLVEGACRGTPYDDPGFLGQGVYDNATTPIMLLQSYYNAINGRDYQRAYNYWETPPGSASLAQFTQGYVNTASVQVFVGLSIQTEGAAGSIYMQVPTLLIASNTNGSQQFFAGCYVTRRSNLLPDATWTLYSASIASVSDFSAGVARLVRCTASA